MEIAFLIPSKDGGEGFQEVLRSIKRNIEYALRSGHVFSYKVIFVLNGDLTKPLSFLKKISQKPHTEILVADRLGKVQSINYALERVQPDYLVISDDDVAFGEYLLTQALRELIENKNLQIIGFENQALPYRRHNIFRRFSYDIVNIRSLRGLFKGAGSFLVGRFLVMRKTAWNVPNEIINEDQYLSLIHGGKYKILTEKIFYEGVSSFRQHFKRVLRLEAGRKQIFQVFKDISKEPVSMMRPIDRQKLVSLGLYHRICYHLYSVLRFFTNKVAPFFVSHKTNYW